MAEVPAAAVTFLGSGSLGVPTLAALHAAGLVHAVVSQPDRPAGRGLKLVPTPVSEWALANGVRLIRTESANEGEALQAVKQAGGPIVVVAFGQRLLPALIEGRLSVNLHPSDLPKWRGAAPIQRAMIAGERRIGVCAIRVADRMDAGNVLERFATEVGDAETAGEALDRIAVEAVPMMVRVVRRLLAGDAAGEVQDESCVSRAAKLSKADASVHFTDSAERVRLRVNGLQPWPGCTVRVAGQELRLLRVGAGSGRGRAGELLADGSIACDNGSVLPMLVQSPGGKAMEWNVWMRGQRVQPGTVVESNFPAGPVS